MDSPGARLHGEHPFLLPADQRDPARRLRGRLAAPVTLWTAEHAGERAGLTVSSVLVGEPGSLLGLVGEDSDLLDAVEGSGRFVVQVLDWSHRRLADAFAFLAPAPGGPFTLAEWRDSPYGPVLATATAWAGCRLVGNRELGWGRLVEAALEHVEIGDDDSGPEDDPLAYRRGRYRHLS